MMQLGTETGSLINHVMSCSPALLPEIGDGATLLSWTDRRPGTVINMFKKGAYDYVTVQCDHYKRIDNNGVGDAQQYEYSRDENGATSTYRLRNGQWEAVYLSETGRYKVSGGSKIVFGRRERYYDFSF